MSKATTTLTRADDSFTFVRLTEAIAAEAALDGLYIIRTSVKAQRMVAQGEFVHEQMLFEINTALRHAEPPPPYPV